MILRAGLLVALFTVADAFVPLLQTSTSAHASPRTSRTGSRCGSLEPRGRPGHCDDAGATRTRIDRLTANLTPRASNGAGVSSSMSAINDMDEAKASSDDVSSVDTTNAATTVDLGVAQGESESDSHADDSAKDRADSNGDQASGRDGRKLRLADVYTPTMTQAILETYVPSAKLSACFDDLMKDDSIPIFQNIDAYMETLPMKYDEKRDQYLPLSKCPFWTTNTSMMLMVRELEAIGSDKNMISTVPYVVGPEGYGKTASILAAFLESVASDREEKFTKYMYMPFRANDAINSFHPHPNLPSIVNHYLEKTVLSTSNIYERLGAQFMLNCVFQILKGPSRTNYQIPFAVTDDGYLPTVFEVTSELEDLIVDYYLDNNKTHGGRVLFHLDETDFMTQGLGSSLSDADASAFQYGAVSVLAKVDATVATAVITASKPPSHVSPRGTDATIIFRQPISLPMLDVKRVMDCIPALKLDTSLPLDNDEMKRLYQTYLFHLKPVMRNELGELMWNNLDLPSGGSYGDLIAATQKINSREVEAGLKDAIAACKALLSASRHNNADVEDAIHSKYATKLLLGMQDENRQNVDGIAHGNLLSMDGYVTAQLQTLLNMKDPTNPIYEQGAQLMRDFMYEKLNDSVSETPLKRAFLWVLSCRSVTGQRIHFRGWWKLWGDFTCTGLKEDKVFADGIDGYRHGSIWNTRRMKLHYIDKASEDKTYPPFDQYIKSRDGTVMYLIAVTCESKEFADQKMQQLREWVDNNPAKRRRVRNFIASARNKKIKPTRYIAIQVAPFANGPTVVNDSAETFVADIRGVDAMDMLGGLKQTTPHNQP